MGFGFVNSINDNYDRGRFQGIHRWDLDTSTLVVLCQPASAHLDEVAGMGISLALQKEERLSYAQPRGQAFLASCPG
jgi:hypothetical protein